MNRLRIATLVFITLSLQGCKPSDDKLWGFGALVFLAFVAIMLLNNIGPKLHELSAVKIIVLKLEIIVKKAFIVLVIAATAIMGTGIYSILTNEDRSRNDLLIFIGAILLYLVINLNRWANETEKYKKRNYARSIGISSSFLMMFGYLLLGAPNISL